jgi:hypothetical protein
MTSHFVDLLKLDGSSFAVVGLIAQRLHLRVSLHHIVEEKLFPLHIENFFFFFFLFLVGTFSPRLCLRRTRPATRTITDSTLDFGCPVRE